MSLVNKIVMNEVPMIGNLMINESAWNGWNEGRMIDDCVGVLLSYLSLVDKFRLESVSKQWQRKIFWSVGYLSLQASKGGKCFVYDIECMRNNAVNADELMMIVRKCHNIEQLEIRQFFKHNLGLEFLSVIAGECTSLSHLKIAHYQDDTGNQVLENFFLKFAPKLKKLEMTGRINVSYYSVCVNLEELSFGKLSLVELSGYFSKLKSLKGLTRASQFTSPEFANFCDLYANQLKKIKLTILWFVEKEELKQLFIQINKLVKLEFISIEFKLLSEISPFTTNELDNLERLTIWKKLKKMKINIGHEVISFNSILESLMLPFLVASHSNLESIKLVIDKVIPHGSKIASITQFVCQRLKRLKLKAWTFIPDGFYEDMHLRFPNLTSLSIQASNSYPNQLIEIKRLLKLESLQIVARDIRFNLFNQFFNNYSKLWIGHDSLRIIHFNAYIIFTISRFHQIIAFASNIPSIKITVIGTNWLDDYNQRILGRVPLIDEQVIDSLKKQLQETSKFVIPSNLNVYIGSKPIIINGIII